MMLALRPQSVTMDQARATSSPIAAGGTQYPIYGQQQLGWRKLGWMQGLHNPAGAMATPLRRLLKRVRRRRSCGRQLALLLARLSRLPISTPGPRHPEALSMPAFRPEVRRQVFQRPQREKATACPGCCWASSSRRSARGGCSRASRSARRCHAERLRTGTVWCRWRITRLRLRLRRAPSSGRKRYSNSETSTLNTRTGQRAQAREYEEEPPPWSHNTVSGHHRQHQGSSKTLALFRCTS
jgi:hypothetical protein